MIDFTIKLGDKVTVRIEEEDRKRGHTPCPNGTEATVLGFSEIAWGRVNNCCQKPGIHENRAWTKIRLSDGTEYFEWSGRLELVDKYEYERRVEEFRKYQKEHPDTWNESLFLRDLPETSFWEGDIVRLKKENPRCASLPSEFFGRIRVVGIDYGALGSTTNDGGDWPAYRVGRDFESCYVAVRTDDLEFVEHGDVWKYFHDEPVLFTSLEEEAEFFCRLGHYRETRNPATGNFAWNDKDEVLSAIRKGVAHGFSLSSGFYGKKKSRHAAIRFHDEALGRRVAEATLAGFAN